MNAELTFLRRTPREIGCWGGEVFIDIDGKPVGTLGCGHLTVSVPAGLHTVKMYTSRGGGRRIGFAEAQLEVPPCFHLLLEYAAPLAATQPGHISLADYERGRLEQEAQRREALLRAAHEKAAQRRAAHKKCAAALLFALAFAALCGLLWGLWPVLLRH